MSVKGEDDGVTVGVVVVVSVVAQLFVGHVGGRNGVGYYFLETWRFYDNGIRHRVASDTVSPPRSNEIARDG